MGEEAWYNGESLNTLVVLDEAHRFAGKRHENDRNHSHLEGLKDRLIDYARTTRKFGLGWMFISTSLSSIDRDILQQLKIVFFGFGLSLGSDFLMLKEMIPDNSAIELYRSFGDPASSFTPETRQFPFMSKGPVSPLSFAGFPLFINAFSHDDFIIENKFDKKFSSPRASVVILFQQIVWHSHWKKLQESITDFTLYDKFNIDAKSLTPE